MMRAFEYDYEGGNKDMSQMDMLITIMKEMQEDIKILFKNQEMLQENDRKLADNMAEIGEVISLMNEDIHDVAKKVKKKKGV